MCVPPCVCGLRPSLGFGILLAGCVSGPLVRVWVSPRCGSLFRCGVWLPAWYRSLSGCAAFSLTCLLQYVSISPRSSDQVQTGPRGQRACTPGGLFLHSLTYCDPLRLHPRAPAAPILALSDLGPPSLRQGAPPRPCLTLRALAARPLWSPPHPSPPAPPGPAAPSPALPDPPGPPRPRPAPPPPAAPGAQLRDTQSPAPPPHPPRSPSPNKSRFLSPQQIKDQEGVKNSFSSPGGGGAREKLGFGDSLMASVWETRRNVAAGTGAAARGSRRRARPPGTPGTPAPLATPPPGPSRPPRPAPPAPQLAEPSRSRCPPLSPFALLPVRSVPQSLFSNSNFSVFFLFFVLLIFLFVNPLRSSTSFFSFLFSLSLTPCLSLSRSKYPSSISSLCLGHTLCASLCSVCFLVAPCLCLRLWLSLVGS